jgi:hypothetical protein
MLFNNELEIWPQINSSLDKSHFLSTLLEIHAVDVEKKVIVVSGFHNLRTGGSGSLTRIAKVKEAPIALYGSVENTAAARNALFLQFLCKIIFHSRKSSTPPFKFLHGCWTN